MYRLSTFFNDSEKLNKIENDLALVKHQSTNNENLEKRKEESDKHTKEAVIVQSFA
jgi:hypothetical protein